MAPLATPLNAKNSGRNEEEGTTTEMLDRRGAGIEEGGTGGVK